MQEQIYTFEIKQPISEKQVITCAFEEQKPSICASTLGGKIFSYNLYDDPQDISGENKLKWLNFNKKINFITTGKIIPKSNRDVIIVASETTLTAYDAYTNSDLFHKEIPDGITTIKCGFIGATGAKPDILVFVGSHCSIQAFNFEGEDCYWNITGDKVLSICFCDVDDDDSTELIVGCEDNNIIIFKDENIETEVNENSPVTDQISFGVVIFGFALKNGSLGVHDKKNLRWKHKQKDPIIGIATFLSDQDFYDAQISGHRTGKVDVRNAETGDCMYTVNLGQNLSAQFKGNLLAKKSTQIVCATKSGQVLGFTLNYEPKKEADDKIESDGGAKALRELIEKKNQLSSEINQLNDLKAQNTKNQGNNRAIIPDDTKQLCAYRYNFDLKRPELQFKTNNTTVIRGVIINGESQFKIDSLAYSNPVAEKVFVFPILTKENQSINLQISVFIGHSVNSKEFKVKEMTKQIPKFACFAPILDHTTIKPTEKPVSQVLLRVKDRISRVKMWLNEAFNLASSQLEKSEEDKQIDLAFRNVRDGKIMLLKFIYDDSYYFELNYDNMELSSEIIQEMCNALDIKDLESYVDYPGEMETFKTVLEKVKDMSKGKIQHEAEMANSVQILKKAMVRSEEARLLNDMKSLKSNISQLNKTNEVLTKELRIKTQQHEDFLTELRKVNTMISIAGNFRHGPSKTKVVNSCRKAIKEKNWYDLLQVIQGEKIQGPMTVTPLPK